MLSGRGFLGVLFCFGLLGLFGLGFGDAWPQLTVIPAFLSLQVLTKSQDMGVSKIRGNP